MTSSLATLEQDIHAASREFRLIPAGVFRSNDGRPAGLPGWKIDAQIALQLIAEAAARSALVIDYDHQSLRASLNGQPAPAAGWIESLEWREGQGLFVTKATWTDKARAMLTAREYRYISPVFSFCEISGRIERLIGAGLTNTPGLSGLTDLAKVAVNSTQLETTPRESSHSIESFNQAFGPSGIYHPQTPPDRLAELTGNVSKPRLSGDLNPQQQEMMRRVFPGTFADS